MLVYDETYTRGACAYTERKQKTEESAPPPVWLDQRRRHLEI